MMKNINRKELIKKYIEFFKKNGHKEIANSSLIPENDSSVLFTTAGMHPLVPYLSGQPHVSGKRLVNVQRCIRTGDIEEVGDATHHTFFEMLGNWSLGDYFKKEAISYTFEFLTEVLKIPVEKLAISCFKGDKNAVKDEESFEYWISLGIPKKRIVFLDKKENWWGPAGKTGPCGPDTEIFYWNSKSKIPEKFDVKDDKWVEIGNDVLMQYLKDKKGKYNEAKQKNIDFGGGVERTLAVLNGYEDNYLTEIWLPIIKKIEKLSGKKYGKNKEETKAMRIIADHIKASVMILADNVKPGNVEQGYVLRRLIRKAVRNLKNLEVPITEIDATVEIAKAIFKIYDDYPHLSKNKEKILDNLKREETKFQKTLYRGLREFEKMIKNNKIDGKKAFLLYQSYGFPIEMTKELAKEKKIKIDEKSFEKELKKHQEISRTSTQGKFKSGLADKGKETTKLHTATHLLLEALNKILDTTIEQRGSNITEDRLRLDFNFDRKLTNKEIKEIEDLINKQIKKGLNVEVEEMSVTDAKKKGARGIFDEKYGNKVSVYSIGDFSKEICAGPHVNNTGELGEFKIKKEESSSAGVRRIKAILL